MPNRRKKKSSNSSTTNYLIFGGIGLAVVLLATVAILVIKFAPRRTIEKLTPVEELVNCNSGEDIFHASLPQGWKIESGGIIHYSWVSAERASAKIKAEEGIAGSLIKDIVGQNYDPNGPDEQLPISRIHEMKQQAFAEEHKNYREEPATTVRNGFGKSRVSAFTTNKVRGYRATSAAGEVQIGIVCTCAPADWDMLQPAFMKVIESAGPGRGK